MPDKEYRVAVIGTGMIANAGHIPAWQDQPGVEIVAVADHDADRAKLVAETFAIPRAYGDWRTMLSESQPDKSSRRSVVRTNSWPRATDWSRVDPSGARDHRSALSW